MKKETTPITERRKLYRKIRDRLEGIVSNPESSNAEFMKASVMIFDMDSNHYNDFVDEWE